MKKILLLLFLISSCKTAKILSENKPNFKLITEFIIPENTIFKNKKIGGLSSIDYSNGFYYLLSDKKKDIHFWKMKLDFHTPNYTITDVISIKTNHKKTDPEAMRFDTETGHFIWTSEGFVRSKIDAAIYQMDSLGNILQTIPIPKIISTSNANAQFGPRRNGLLECLSMSTEKQFIWVGMELPLKQDGLEPQLAKGNYPVRISKINKKTGQLDYQFAYLLDEVAKDSKPSGKFKVNGLSEILEIEPNVFLFIERSFSTGYLDKGHTVKIYKVDAKNATDITTIDALKKVDYIPAKKTLLFNFNAILPQLKHQNIDNIEGITFGPKLPNGNQTLVLVSDNNYNFFGNQINQIIVLEVLPQ